MDTIEPGAVFCHNQTIELEPRKAPKARNSVHKTLKTLKKASQTSAVMLKSLSPKEHAECKTSKWPPSARRFENALRAEKSHAKILCEKARKRTIVARMPCRWGRQFAKEVVVYYGILNAENSNSRRWLGGFNTLRAFFL